MHTPQPGSDQTSLLRDHKNGSAPWWVYVSCAFSRDVKSEREAYAAEYRRIEQATTRPKRQWLKPQPGKVGVFRIHTADLCHGPPRRCQTVVRSLSQTHPCPCPQQQVYVCMVHAPGKTKEDGVVVCKTEQTALLHYLVLMCGLRPGGDTRSAVDALLHRVETTANAQAYL